MMDKHQLPVEIVTPRTLIRQARPEDLPIIAAWPSYPWPHNWANMTNELARSDNGRYWWELIDVLDRCHYCVVHEAIDEVIGVHAFAHIDWAKGVIGTMGIRIRPDLCGQGYGSETLEALLKGVLGAGIQNIRLDVAATNKRAIRCYEKCGMYIVEEFWREHKGEPIDSADPKWGPLLPNLRREGDKWMIRFYWMELLLDEQ